MRAPNQRAMTVAARISPTACRPKPTGTSSRPPGQATDVARRPSLRAGGTTSTGTVVSWSTPSVVDPKISRRRAPSPCVPMTTRSHLVRRIARAISVARIADGDCVVDFEPHTAGGGNHGGTEPTQFRQRSAGEGRITGTASARPSRAAGPRRTGPSWGRLRPLPGRRRGEGQRGSRRKNRPGTESADAGRKGRPCQKLRTASVRVRAVSFQLLSVFR